VKLLERKVTIENTQTNNEYLGRMNEMIEKGIEYIKP